MGNRKDDPSSKTAIKPGGIVSIKYLQKKSIKMLFPVVFAFVLTIFVFLILMPTLKLFKIHYVDTIVDVVTNRGAVQYFTIFFFWLVIGKIILGLIRIKEEERSFIAIRQNFELKEGNAWSDAEQIIQKLEDQKFSPYNKSILFKRIKEGLLRIRNTQDTNALVEYFKLRSELEYTEMESEFTEIKYYNWLIPILGFIGTVLGIGVGIRGFADLVIQAQGFEDVRNYLPNVTHNLGIAFDTTLLALVLSAIGIFFSSFLTKKYSKLLESIDSYCLDEISGKFKLYSTLADQLQRVFNMMNQDLVSSLRSNLLEIKNEVKRLFDSAKENSDKSLVIMSLIANKIPNMQPINNSIDKITEDIEKIRVTLDSKGENDKSDKSSSGNSSKNDSTRAI